MAIKGGKIDSAGEKINSIRLVTDGDGNTGLGDVVDPIRVDPTGTTVQPVSVSGTLPIAGVDPTGTQRSVAVDVDGHLASVGGWRLPVIVQKTNAVTGSAGTSISCAFSSNVKRGNTLVVCFAAGVGTAAPVISDTLNSEYVNANLFNTSPTVCIAYARASASGANTVSITWTGSAAGAVEIYEVAGIGGVDVAGLSLNSTTAAPSVVVYNLRPNSLGFFVVAAGAATISNNNPASPNNLSFDSGNLTPSGAGTLNNFGCFSTQLGPQQSTQACKCTLSGSVVQSSITVAFRPEAIEVSGQVSLMGRAGGTGTELPLLTDTTGNLSVAKTTADADGTANASGGSMSVAGAASGAPLAIRGYLYNGTTWDRQRANFDTVTGDTGALGTSTTFNGATQTNFNARGAYINAVLSAVGATVAVQLQWSPDGGTTWITIGAATATIVAAGNLTILIYPNANGALVTGSGQTLSLDAPLPRTWRLTYIVGTGTNTLTKTNVNYIV